MLDYESMAALEHFLNEVRSSHCLDTRDCANLPAGTKYVISFSNGCVLDMEMLDPETGRAIFFNNQDIKGPTEGRLEGSIVSDNAEQPGAFQPRRFHKPGQICRLGTLFYEIDGKTRIADSIWAVKILLKSGKAFDLWRD